MSTAAGMKFDWTELAFASKKPVSELTAIFIAAPDRKTVPAQGQFGFGPG